MEDYKLIPLTQGQFVKVDADDYPALIGYKWREKYSKKGTYAIRTTSRKLGKQRLIQMHRQIMGAPPGMDVDHINHDCLDNRRSNLRVCTRGENLRNQQKRANTSSQYKGVHWQKQKKRWRARINPNGKRQRHLGYHATELEAALAYDEAARKYHGEFALLNFPDEEQPADSGAAVKAA